jgi:class 3 adenylate cyclase
MEPAGRGRVERRLAAILAADVAGYSRLIGADEGGTLERLRALRRELLDPKMAEHKGRLVKTTGDGLLVEFGSVVGALRWAPGDRFARARQFTCSKIAASRSASSLISPRDVSLLGWAVTSSGTRAAFRNKMVLSSPGHPVR